MCGSSSDITRAAITKQRHVYLTTKYSDNRIMSHFLKKKRKKYLFCIQNYRVEMLTITEIVNDGRSFIFDLINVSRI